MSGGRWTNNSRGCVLVACVEAQLFDAALEIVKDYPELAVSEGSTILQILARKPCSRQTRLNYMFKKFYADVSNVIYLVSRGHGGYVDEENQAIELLKKIWENIVKLPKAKVDEILRGPADQLVNDKYPSRVLFVAAEMGNTAFIVELIRQYPERVLELNDNKQTIFHVAISHRHVGVYCLLHQIGSIKASIINLDDENENNMLHHVGIFKKKETSRQYVEIKGPVHEMNEELAWFQS
ncbi:hypothetical protein L2E82_22705 [Cichorium intybus]|uniref:Uncharacterized protein n=1 Tax=Cichorium intybus TaxID=13427 RepID=A0ACB9DXZ1_CICIN|nr:hypothetical protein L2E82_22705 [Cichorium intybus]